MKKSFNISGNAIRYPRQVIAFWLGVIVAGILAYSSLKYALFPEISYPVVVVIAQKSSLSTTTNTEAQLTNPIEKSLKNLANVKQIYSTSYPGSATISILFTPGTVLETSTKQTKDILAPYRGFDLKVVALNLNESPVISYALTSNGIDPQKLREIAQKELIPNLEKVEGVLKVNLLGDSNIKNIHKKDSSYLKNKYPSLVHFQGKTALALEVVKKSNANTLDVVNLTQREVQNLKRKYQDIDFNLAETQDKYIKAATRATVDELILAVLLAIGVIFLFLRSIRATIIPALAIPTSLLGTFIVMAAFNFNLETLTLLALTMVIGIVVDDAIVDVENIARLIEQGEDTRSAVINGTNEIGLSVIASTLTIVAVFLPVGLMAGSVGKFFKPFGLTISAAVLFSLLVARTLTPVLCLKWLKPQVVKEVEFPLIAVYERLLCWALAHRKTVMILALFSFLAGIAFIPFIPKGFVPILDHGEFNVMYSTALPRVSFKSFNNDHSSNIALDWMDELAKSPETFLLRRTMAAGHKMEVEILNTPEIESAFTVAGINGQPNQGKIYVKMKQERTKNTFEMQEYIREHLPHLKGVSFSVEDIPFVQTEANKQLQLAILGNNLKTLLEAAQNLKNQVIKISGFKDVALSNSALDAENPFKIEHLDGQRMIYLSSNLSSSLALEDATLKVEKLSQEILPKEITLQRWGNSADSSNVLISFGTTMVLSTILLLLVLFFLFGRLLEPIVIGLSLPLAIVGAMFGLWITRSDFGIISLLGLIFLLGLLSKNSILLLDYVKRLRESGMERKAAIIKSARVRLRPIVMTTAATILGMLPITLGIGAGAQLRQPMAVSIVGGLLTSTLLSLIVVPVLYTLLDDLWYKNEFN